LINNNGDIVKTLQSLFLGFDELTITWYTAIVSMVALKVLGTIFSTSLATGIGIIIGVFAAIIMLILNWDEFVSWLTHSLSNEQVEELEKSIEGSLEDTLGLIGKLNDMRPEGYAAQARNYRNMYGKMLRRAYFAQYNTDSGEYLNLSKYAFDFYKANRDIGMSVPRVTCAVKLFWFIANDFDNTYYPHGQNNAYAWISLDTISRNNWELNEFLDGMTKEKAESTVINYNIYSNPNLDAHEQWQSDLERISNFLSNSIDKFQDAMSRLKFLNLFPNPTVYSREYGAIIVDYEPRSGLNSLDLNIWSSSGSFKYAYDGLWHDSWSFSRNVSPDANGYLRSTVLIVEPRDYEIKVLNPNIPIKGASGTLTVYNGKCTNHYVEVEKEFSFTLNNTYDGHVYAQFYKDGIVSESREFNSQDSSIISVQPGVQTYESLISWDTDGNLSNGYEVTKSLYWNSDKLSEYGTAYSKGFWLEVRIGDPFTTESVEEIWT
jgi:hypothetical protein